MLDAGTVAPSNEARVETLGFAGQFVIWAVRQWVFALGAPPECGATLRIAFAKAGVPGALRHLDGLLGTIATAAERDIEFRCPCSTVLGPDEVQLLRCIARFQRGRLEAADLTHLGSWLPPAAVRVAHGHAERLAVELLSVGLKVGEIDAAREPAECSAGRDRVYH